MIYKIIWMLQSIFMRIFFKKFHLSSYVALPLFCTGLRHVSIGKNVRIFPRPRLEVHFDGEILFEEDVSIGQNFHVTAGGKLIISKGVIISANAFVTDIDHEYDNIQISVSRQPLKVSPTFIGENCFIGFGACIQAGTHLGKHCVVGCNSVVRGSFPDYSVIVGAPARIVKKYNFSTQSWERTDKYGNFIDEK